MYAILNLMDISRFLINNRIGGNKIAKNNLTKVTIIISRDGYLNIYRGYHTLKRFWRSGEEPPAITSSDLSPSAEIDASTQSRDFG